MHTGRRLFRALVLVSLGILTGACARRPALVSDGMVSVGDSVSLFYSVMGHGPDTVVVLHGGPGLHHGYLVDAVTPLLDGRTFILYDQRGRGRSTPVPDSALTLAADMRDLEALRQHFQLGRMKIFAHQWGAVLAALYARQYPDGVARMLVVSPPVPRIRDLFVVAAGFPHDSAQGAAYLAATRRREDIVAPVEFCRRFWGFAFSPAEVTDRRIVGELSASMCDLPAASLVRSAHVGEMIRGSLNNYSIDDTLARVAAPVLVIEGDGPSAAVLGARAWSEHLANAREVLLPPPAVLPWLGDTRAFRRASKMFLDGSWPEEARPVRMARGS